MSTSPRGGRVRFPEWVFDDREPVTAHRARNLVANNALHYADTKCSHMVNWLAPSEAASGKDLSRRPDPVSTDYTRLGAWGPFRITRRDDGAPYTMRLRLRAGVDGVAGVTCTFALVVVPDLPSSLGLVGTVAAGLGATYTTTSLTPAWLSVVDGADVFVPSRHALRRYRTLVDTGGADIEAEVATVHVAVFAKSANAATTTPVLYGVHVSEYVGT